MKKYLFLAAALIAMGCGMTSCSSDAEEVIEQSPKLTKLVFTVAQDAKTRVAWGGTNDCTPVFEEGDKVSLFSENNTNTMLTAHVADGVVTLEGEGVADDNLYFVYPYEASAVYNEGIIYGGVKSAYDLEHNNVRAEIGKYPRWALSMAKSTDGGASAITFQGLMAIFKFTATQYYDCGQIMIQIGDGYEAYSRLSIDVNNCAIRNANFSYLNMGFDFEEGKTYYMAVPPFAMPENGRIYLRSDNGNYSIFEGAKTFEAGKIYNLTVKSEL